MVAKRTQFIKSKLKSIPREGNMRKILTALILCLCLLATPALPNFYDLKYDLVGNAPILSNSQALSTQTTTGATYPCYTGNSLGATIDFGLIAGTATVKFQCLVTGNGTWRDLTDNSGNLITMTSSGIFANPNTYTCTQMRAYITACVGCVVTVSCNVRF